MLEERGDLEQNGHGAGSLAGGSRREGLSQPREVPASAKRFQALPRASWVAWRLIFSVNLTGFKITYKAYFWMSVRGFSREV